MGAIDGIKYFEVISGMRRDRESGQDGENGEELSRVRKSSFYSNSLILEHVPSRNSSTHGSIVSHVEAFDQIALFVG
ncbi:hypothetical protein IG631_00024 [Alternaria alternata]|nr:hypothetical protein IG631_00024 [Alternaria alternata]